MTPRDAPRKRLTDDERLRVAGKLRALQAIAARSPGLEGVFHYCDRLRFSVLAGSLSTDDVARLKRLFDEHGVG